MKVFQALAVLLLIGATTPGSFVAGQTPANATRIAAAAKATNLPPDVFPDSLSRVPLAKREDLSEAGKKLYDSLDSDDYQVEVGLWSGAGIKLHVPGLAETDSINSFLRKTPLGRREYELATLVVSREMNSQVMWTAHEPQALEDAVSREAIDVVKFRKPVTALGEREATIIQFGRELFLKDKVSSDTFARAEKVFGRQGVVILTAIMAYRTGTPLLFRAFDQHLNPNLKPLLATVDGPRALVPLNAARSSAAASAATLPKDVFPDSFSRVPLVKREDLNEAEKKTYDALDAVDRRGGVGLRGPAGIRFHVPGLAAADSSNEFMRKTPLGRSEYELAILIAAREANAQVMWTAHEPEALERGVTREAIDVIKFRKPISGLGERETTIIQFGRELFQKDKVSSDTFTRAEKLLGRQGVVTLTTMFGTRTGTVLFTRAFDQHLNPKTKPLLPIP